MSSAMKRFILFVLVTCLFSVTVSAQVSGDFLEDGGEVYFRGRNVSGQALRNLSILCVNGFLGQKYDLRVDYLEPDGTFMVGPADGWTWRPGEQLFVTLADGRMLYWTYRPDSSYEAPVRPDPYDNQRDSYYDNMLIQEEIRQLEYKIRDARRSLRMYERWNEKDPSISTSQLVIAQWRLIRTYEERIQQLLRMMR